MQVLKSLLSPVDSLVAELSHLEHLKKDEVYGNNEYEYFLREIRYSKPAA